MQVPIIFNDRYQLNTKLGEGGLAEVYLAQDLALSRMVAVKLLRTQYTSDPTFLVRFHREAQNAASLNSSNVVSVYDFGQDHNRPYIVMEFVSGDDLRTKLDKGKLAISQAVDHGIQIHGAMGESLDLPLSLFFRYLRHGQIGGGGSEIQRMQIARKLLKE